METKALQDLLIQILRFELNEKELDDAAKEQLTPDVIPVLYSLSKQHDLAHVVASALYKSGLLKDEEILAKFRREEGMSVYRYEQMKYAYEEICYALGEEGIPYIPLKGSVIRPYYPKESMRTSCDIDILVQEENLDRAIDALVKKGFEQGEKNFHDVSLYSPNKIHLELHFSIQENIDSLDKVLNDAWRYAIPKEGGRYAFTEEFFLFHIFAHASYHFLSGGCGIRPLMDIWIMQHKMGIAYPQAKELLEEAGIYTFAEEIGKLVDVCFSGAPKDDFADTLLSYIFSGGVYGTSRNKIAVSKAKTNSTFVYALKRVFLPYKTMTFIYPILKKVPILLPFCWIARVGKLLFGGKTKRALVELKTANSVSEDKIEAMKQIRTRLGL